MQRQQSFLGQHFIFSWYYLDSRSPLSSFYPLPLELLNNKVSSLLSLASRCQRKELSVGHACFLFVASLLGHRDGGFVGLLEGKGFFLTERLSFKVYKSTLGLR